MSIQFSDLSSWRSASLGAAGDALKADIEELESACDVLKHKTIPDSWTGLAADAATALQARFCMQMEELLEGKRKMRAAFYTAEVFVEEIERGYSELTMSASTQAFEISGDGKVSDAAEPPRLANRYEMEEWSRSRKAWVESLEGSVTMLLSKAAEADMVLANGIPAGHVDHIDNYGVASPEVAAQWAQMTDAEKHAFVEEYVKELAAEAGLDVPNIAWMTDAENSEAGRTRGSWSEQNKSLSVQEYLLADPSQLMHTLAHEMRHARQYEAARDASSWHWPWTQPFEEHENDGISREQAEEWNRNFKDYKSTGRGATYEEYFDQPVEADARAGGKKGVKEMTANELRRLAKEGA